MSHRTRIKFCGITQLEDANTAMQLGVDALGFNFYSQSSRYITTEIAASIVKAMPAFLSCCGVFVNHDAKAIEQVLQTVPLHVLQFHGDEPADFCRQFNKPYIKAIRVQGQQDIFTAEMDYPDAQALLLDTYVKDQYGGTGEQFNWQLVPAVTERKLAYILAGGLRVNNIVTALQQVQPYAIDIAGGIEAAPGKKAPTLMKQIIEEVTNYDRC